MLPPKDFSFSIKIHYVSVPTKQTKQHRGNASYDPWALHVSLLPDIIFPINPPRHKSKTGSEPDEQFCSHTSPSQHLFRRHLKHNGRLRPARASCARTVRLMEKWAPSQSDGSPRARRLAPLPRCCGTSATTAMTNGFSLLLRVRLHVTHLSDLIADVKFPL